MMKKYFIRIMCMVILAMLYFSLSETADAYNIKPKINTSAGLASSLSDETGTGQAVFGTSPTIATPTITGKVGFDTTTPAGQHHVVLSAGKPAIFGGDTNATLTGVTISNADPSVLTKDATIDDGLAVGDLVVVNSGTNCTVGEYVVTGITADTNVTLDKQAATGACSAGNITYVNGEGLTVSSTGQMILSDGVGATIIRQFNEPGLGSRFTFGLPEVSRTLVIADAGDVDTDLGLGAANYPTLIIADNDVSDFLRIYQGGAIGYIDNAFASSNSEIIFYTSRLFLFRTDADLTTGNLFGITSSTNIELASSNAEQAGLYVEPKINQTSTAAYNGLHVNVLETTPGSSFGDGSTGQGNNLLLLERESVPYFKVDRDGTVSILGDNANAPFTHVYLINTDETSTGETSQTTDLVFQFTGTQNNGSSYAAAEVARISAFKSDDWYHASDGTDHDGGFKFYGRLNGAEVEMLAISPGSANFKEQISLLDDKYLFWGNSTNLKIMWDLNNANDDIGILQF
ncbi:hypothetical protein LCGC14_0958360, partial [marine sediment metagenome]